MAVTTPPTQAVPHARGGRRALLLGLLLVAVAAMVVMALTLRAIAPSPEGPTIWQAITSGIGDGPVPRDIALEAIAYEFGVSIPGITVPAGRDGDDVPSSGTGAIRWVQGVWSQLSPEQRAVIEPFLHPEPGGTRITIDVPGYSTPSSGSANPRPGAAHVVLAADDPLRDAIVSDLEHDLAHLGPKLGLSPIEPGSDIGSEAPRLGQVSLEMSNDDGGNTLMYTYGAINDDTRLYSACNVRVYRNAWEGEQPVAGRVSDRLHVLLTHEAVHCYQHALTSSIAVLASMPIWVAEGSAAWLAADDTRLEEPSLPSDWRGWLNPSDKRLVERKYDAIGFLSLLDHLGRNLWSLMVPAWRAAFADPANASSAFLAVLGGDDPDVQQAWAPSLARRGDWGDPWEAHGFGLHADAQAHLYPMAALAEPVTGEIDARSARLGEVSSSDGEVVTVETTGLVSAHDDAGNQLLGATTMTLCTVASCVCPPETARAGEDVADQPMRTPFVLAFYAPRDGTTYTVAGHHLADLCGAEPTTGRAPTGGGGPGPAGRGTAGGGGGAPGGASDDDPCAGGCAKSNGDPHLVTVDGHLYDFQAAGEFTLLRSADGAVEIQARQVPWPGSDHLAVNRAISARVGSHAVGVYDTAGRFEIHVDGAVTPVEGPIDLAGGGRIVPYQSGIELDLPDGTRAWVIVVGRWGLMVRIAPSPALASASSGLLGPVRPGLGVPAMPDGSAMPGEIDPQAARAALYGPFADGWRVTDATSLFDYAPGTSTASFTVAGFPAAAAGDTLDDLTTDQRAAGEQACAAVTAPDLHDACAFDAGATGEADAADAYALAQAFDAAGPSALAGAPSSGPPSATPSAPETVPPLASMPGGVSELVPEAQALLGQALGPNDRLVLSVQLADGTDAVVATDAMLVAPPIQVPLAGGGPVAIVGGSVWVGETLADGTCAIARLESHTLVTAATVPIACDQGRTSIAALGDDLWFVDTSAVGPDGTGAVLRRLDPSNQPSSTTIPIPIPVTGTTLLEGTDAASLVLRSNDHALFLAQGAATFADLGPLPGSAFGVSSGAWSADPATGLATLRGPAGVLATIPIAGHLVGADDEAVLVEVPGDAADTLTVATPGGGSPVLVASGSQIDTAAGTTVPLGYQDEWPLVIGGGHAVKLWLPTSRTSPSALAVDAQWASIR